MYAIESACIVYAVPLALFHLDAVLREAALILSLKEGQHSFVGQVFHPFVLVNVTNRPHTSKGIARGQRPADFNRVRPPAVRLDKRRISRFFLLRWTKDTIPGPGTITLVSNTGSGTKGLRFGNELLRQKEKLLRQNKLLVSLESYNSRRQFCYHLKEEMLL